MGFKTVLVHLGLDAEAPRRLAAAVAFARQQDALLRGAFIVLPMQVPGVPLGASLSDARQIATPMAQEKRAVFEETCRREGVRCDWVFDLGDMAEQLAIHGRCADAIIISQGASKGPLQDYHASLTEFLPFAASAPVIVLPRGKDSIIDPGNIAIAWKSSKEAAAAVRDALPLLKEAGKVTVVTVREPGSQEIQGQDLSAFLAEHGVAVDVHTLTARETGTGDAILAEAASVQAGLIVMGVYGHSRLRLRILGGVSRYILANSPVPLLVTH